MAAKAFSEVKGLVEDNDREHVCHRKKNVFTLVSDSGDAGLSDGSASPPLVLWDGTYNLSEPRLCCPLPCLHNVGTASPALGCSRGEASVR